MNVSTKIASFRLSPILVMSADLELGQTIVPGDDTNPQGMTTSPTMIPVESGVPDIVDSTSSDDSELVSDNIPITPSDLPPPLTSSVSEPFKPTLKPNHIPLPRGPGRGGVGGNLRAPLMSNTSSTPIPSSLQARLAAVSVSSHPLARFISTFSIG